MLFNIFKIQIFFLNASVGHWKCCGRPHAACKPVVGPHWYKEYDTCHMYYIFIFRERSSFRSTSPGSEVPCCQQQLECERKTLELLWDRCLKILSQLTSDSVLASPSVLSSVKVINKQVSSAKIFYFQAW